jgi:hypothetical protein
MTGAAGFIRDPDGVAVASGQSVALIREMRRDGLSAASKAELPHAWETENLAVAQAAFLKSIDFYIQNGGGSRGSYLVKRSVSDAGERLENIEAASGQLFSHRKERPEHRKQRIKVSGDDFDIRVEEVRPLPKDDNWYETVWAEYRGGRIF